MAFIRSSFPGKVLTSARPEGVMLSNIDSTPFKVTPRWTTLSFALFLLHDRGPVTVQFLIGLPRV